MLLIVHNLLIFYCSKLNSPFSSPFCQAKNVFCLCRRKKELPQQTDPPSIPVIELIPSGEFPEGEIQQYKDEYVFLYLTVGSSKLQCVLLS